MSIWPFWPIKEDSLLPYTIWKICERKSQRETLRVCLVHGMGITIGIVIFITSNKVCCNVITKHIH